MTRLVLRDVPAPATARLVAETLGYEDVDLEPTGQGTVKVTATGRNKAVSITGASVNDACEKLIHKLAGLT